MEKNGEYEGTVVGLGTDGEGIINIEGTTAFVPFCLVGERVKFKVLKAKGSVAYGKLIKVISPSRHRREAVCLAFGKCGGCDLQHASYEAQLEFKRESVASALKKIGGIEADVSPVVECGKQYGYRNKISLPIGVDAAGSTVAGFYARRSNRIVQTPSCAIQAEWAEDLISAVNEYIEGSNLKGYDPSTGSGELRHIVVREIKGRFIVALVAARNVKVDLLIGLLEKRFKEFTFLLNINSKPTNVIFGNEWRVCRGSGFYEAEENGVRYKAGANTFLQVNDDVRGKLYSRVLEEVPSDAVVIDAYSGGGMLTAMIAKKCKKAFGIEIVEEASRCADELKKLNGLDDKMFNICGKAEDEIERVIAAADGGPRVIVCDPPRKGMERSVVRAIAGSGAEKIILISCNPATLARDLGLLSGTLTESGGVLVKNQSPVSDYEIESVTPFDMFPQTKWCETLVCLRRKCVRNNRGRL